MKCTLKGCTKNGYTRGLCGSHYQSVSALVLKGRFTWDELEKARVCLPKKFGSQQVVHKTIEEMLKESTK